MVSRFQGYVHFGVALSDVWAISWNDSDSLEFERTDFFSESNEVSDLRERQIYANLIASVPAFHTSDWSYSLSEWNCEHWARLVVFGEAISRQPLRHLIGIPFRVRNQKAEEQLAYWIDRRGRSESQKLYH